MGSRICLVDFLNQLAAWPPLAPSDLRELWPAIAAVERLAYRTLSTFWALEQLGNALAREAAASMFVNDGAVRVRGAIDGFVAAILSGSAIQPLPSLPHVLETELVDLRECLLRYAPPAEA